MRLGGSLLRRRSPARVSTPREAARRWRLVACLPHGTSPELVPGCRPDPGPGGVPRPPGRRPGRCPGALRRARSRVHPPSHPRADCGSRRSGRDRRSPSTIPRCCRACRADRTGWLSSCRRAGALEVVEAGPGDVFKRPVGGRGRSGAAGVLPLGLGGQSVPVSARVPGDGASVPSMRVGRLQLFSIG